MASLLRALIAFFASVFISTAGFAQAPRAIHPWQQSDGRWGYVNDDQCWVIGPQFQRVGNFSEGLAAVRVGERNGYIDRTGRMAINPQFSRAYLFRDGRAGVQIGSRYMKIDRTGRVLLDPTCSTAR